MPIMDLPQLHLPEFGLYWFAVTRMPREPELHRKLMEAGRNQAIRSLLTKVDFRSVDKNVLLEFLLPAASGPRLFDVATNVQTRQTSSGYNRADIAVALFLYVLSCARSADPNEPATLENARKFYGTAGGKYRSYPGLGRSELINIWNDFSPAVHLLAVEKLLSPEWESQITAGQAPFWAIVLALSERLRLLGERHKPARSKTSLLNPAETWKVPDWVVLPALPLDWPHLGHPSRLRAELHQWPHPRDVRNSVDMST